LRHGLFEITIPPEGVPRQIQMCIENEHSGSS